MAATKVNTAPLPRVAPEKDAAAPRATGSESAVGSEVRAAVAVVAVEEAGAATHVMHDEAVAHVELPAVVTSVEDSLEAAPAVTERVAAFNMQREVASTPLEPLAVALPLTDKLQEAQHQAPVPEIAAEVPASLPVEAVLLQDLFQAQDHMVAGELKTGLFADAETGSAPAGDELAEIIGDGSAEIDTAILAQLFGIDAEHGAPVDDEVDDETGLAEDGQDGSLTTREVRLGQAFVAAGHAGGILLEDLVALDAELDELLAEDERGQVIQAELPQLESFAAPDVESDVQLTDDEPVPVVMLPDVQPVAPTEADTEAGYEAAGTQVVVTEAPAVSALTPELPEELLQSLEPSRVEAVQSLLTDVTQIVRKIERVAGSDEDAQALIGWELEIWCEQLFDTLGVAEYSDELIRQVVGYIMSPEAMAAAKDESPPNIKLLNYLGTKEYETTSQASLLGSIIQAIQDRLRPHRWLGRYALQVGA